MNFPITIQSKDYHKSMLTILNFNLGLSKLELDMVAILLNHNMTIVDSSSREVLRNDLHMTSFNVNNYIASLRKKKILITKPADKNLYLNRGIIDIVKDKKVSFEFILNGE